MMPPENPDTLFNHAFDRIVSTAERVGVPIATFAVGAWAIFPSPQLQISVLPWLGTALILASLATYVWLTARTTTKAPPPPPIEMSAETRDMLRWMRAEISKQHEWARERKGNGQP